MKKTKLSIGLMACLLSAGTLAGCDNILQSSKDGVLISFNGQQIYADEILEEHFKDSSKYQDIYNSIYSLVVRNYFNVEGLSVNNPIYVKNASGKYELKSENKVNLGKADFAAIEARADKKIEFDRDTAKTNASTNKTSVKKELEAICTSNGVEYDKKLTNLKNKYIDEIKQEMFDKDLYTYYLKDIVLGAGAVTDGKTMSLKTKGMWKGYFESELPYHVSHILVKLEDSSGKYADGTISEANAKKLYNVVNQIAYGDDSFSTLAHDMFKDDAGSAANGGDLGIMDLSTSYVNEFKLGIYAYENLYEPILKGGVNKAIGSNIDLGKNQGVGVPTIKEKYQSAADESFDLVDGLPVIDYSVFEELNKYADVTKSDNKDVIEGNALVYPRNIIYNKELNRHSIAFITGDPTLQVFKENDVEYKWVEDPSVTENGEGKLFINGKGYKKIEAKSGTGFVKFGDLSKPILAVKVAGDWQPIICVRAGSGDYEGIHFIVINRSAFTTGVDANGVTMEEYYTTFYPDQKENYPKDAGGVNKKTYVNFASPDQDKTKAKAEELTAKFKEYDSSRFNKYIFKKFCEIENIKIYSNDNIDLGAKLDNWIDTTLEKANSDKTETWNKTWTEYIDTLTRQSSERSKLVSNACKLIFKSANVKDKTIYAALKEELKLEDATFYDDARVKEVLADVVKFYADVEDEASAKTFIENTKVSSVFKEERGLCNDGKEHK